MNEQILQEISEFCRQRGLAESTFGRRAVNDGKLASRLRHGGRITTETLDRIRGFMATNRNTPARPAVIERTAEHAAQSVPRPLAPSIAPAAAGPGSGGVDPQRNFRFFDNRQKYLLFVNTCSEKWVVAHRVSLELANIHPRPPALRLFDAMKERMRSSVSVVMRPPWRSRLASLPSLTARRPNVDSASPVWRQ